MKQYSKILLPILLVYLGIFYYVGAAPAENIFRNLRPEANSTYEIGTTSAKWLRIYTDNASTSALTVSGLGNTGTECLQINNQGVVDNSGSGCGGGGGGGGAGFGNTWQLLTNDLNTITPTTTTIGIQVNASSTFDRLFARFATTTQATTTDILTSTGNTFLGNAATDLLEINATTTFSGGGITLSGGGGL